VRGLASEKPRAAHSDTQAMKIVGTMSAASIHSPAGAARA
jgi:hypothetical protein